MVVRILRRRKERWVVKSASGGGVEVRRLSLVLASVKTTPPRGRALGHAGRLLIDFQGVRLARCAIEEQAIEEDFGLQR